MHKGQERANVKVHYEFGNDSMKIMCFQYKAKTKVSHRIKILKLCIIVFFSRKL
jgi:hypothetical protein